MAVDKVLLSTARIWGFLSLLFLSYMLIAHLFGNESMRFIHQRELYLFLLFPMGIIFGIFVAYRSALMGGSICLVSVLLSCWMLPELIKSFYYLFSVLPGILFLIYGCIQLFHVSSK